MAREAFDRNSSPVEVANLLSKRALDLAVYDNVTVVVVRFIHSRPQS